MPAALHVLLDGLANAAAAALLLGGFAFGGFGLLPRRLRPVHDAVALPLALSTGAAAYGFLAWVGGALVGTWTTVPLFALLVGAGFRSARDFAAASRRLARRLWALLGASWLLSLALAAFSVALLPQLLLPLVDSDGLRYHVALPKLFLLSGKVFLYPWDYTAALPQSAEMAFQLALALGRLEAPKYVHFGFFLALLAVLPLAVHRGRSTRLSAVAAALLFAVTPAASAVAPAAFVDLVVLFQVVVAWLVVGRTREPALSAIPLGAALATKLTAGPALAAIGLWALVRAGRGRRLRTALLVGLGATAVAAPVLVRNLAAFRDPFFPMGHVLVGAKVPGVEASFVSIASEWSAAAGPLGMAFGEGEKGRVDDVVGWHHALGLALLPLALRDRRFRPALVLAAPFVVLAVAFALPARYLLPLVAALALVEGLALSRLPSRAVPLAALLAAIPAASVSLRFAFRAPSPLAYVTGRLGREELLARAVPGARAARFVNDLPPGRVMALDFPAPALFDVPWIAEGMLHEAPLAAWVREARSPEELLARLSENGVRYLVVTPGYGGGTPASLLPIARTPEETARVAALRARLTRLGTFDGVDVYACPEARR